MKIRFLTVLGFCLLSACSYPDGIRPLSYDGYEVTVPVANVYGGVEGAEKIAKTRSQDYCRSLTAEHVFISTDTTEVDSGRALSVVFQCKSKRFPGLY